MRSHRSTREEKNPFYITIFPSLPHYNLVPETLQRQLLERVQSEELAGSFYPASFYYRFLVIVCYLHVFGQIFSFSYCAGGVGLLLHVYN